MVKWWPLWRKKEYRVSLSQDDWVTPEETLLDASSGHSDIEVPISAGVFRFATMAVLTIFLSFLGVAFYFSVVRGDYFSTLAVKNKTVNFSVPPPRGLIVDRNEKPLVVNIPSFDILVVSRERLGRSDQDINAVADILNLNREEFKTVVSDGMKKNAIFFAAVNITKEQVLMLRQADPIGFYVITGTRRSYVDGAQFSSVLGYVGKVNKDDLTSDSHYLPSDTIGHLGVEASYEKELRGDHGKITFTKKGAENKSEDPVMGNTVVLNIDYSLQKRLYNELFTILRGAGLSSAAAVIQDPRTGAVLAMASFPDFDNNIFSDQVSLVEYRRLFESKSRPLFNRVISGLYNPGSTIKPFIGLVALEEKVITPQDTIQDCINLTVPNPFNPDEPYIYKNWREDFGPFNLRRAIADSCNVYFFTVGGGFGDMVGLGVRRIGDYLTRGLAGSLLSIDLPGEEKGFVPTPEWKQETRGEPWYQGDTYNISIGQGDLLVTPLWLNSYVSAIANGGTIWQPHVANRILDEQRVILASIDPFQLAQLPFSKQNISEVKNAMRETVLTGTAKLLQDLPVSAGAKTGTAEVVKGKSINSLFSAFAPFDSPEIAITVLVEGSSSNEGYAIRAAHNVLKAYFGR